MDEAAGGRSKKRRDKEGIRGATPSSCSCSMTMSSSLLRLRVLLLFVALLLGDGFRCASALSFAGGGGVTRLKLERIQRHLRALNKPSVRSIESPDGDIIDCVPKHNQPALDHPLLKDHKIQTVLPERPRFMGERHVVNYSTASNAARRAFQAWHHVGHCPKGTVPIRRISVDDVLRSKTLFVFGKKQVRSAPALARRVDAPDVVSGNGHEHAIAYTNGSQEIYGAKATINVWDPSIQEANEFSLSQVWILSGSFEGADLNSIEAGWQVSPELYGDSKPRLFTYWTSDAYQATGCYNIQCPGFIQTSSNIAIGAAISPVSSFAGNQYDISILIWKDPKLGNWWMSFGDDHLVGYWPAELFTHLSDHATMVEWGGEIVNSRADGGHTKTQMGSGHFADDGFARASYIRNLEIVDADNSLTAPESIATLAENSNCYNIKSSYDEHWGSFFYYGGPGSSPQYP